MQTRKVVPAVLVVAAFLVASQAQAQSWNYQTYNSKGPAALGYVTLEEKDGEYTFKMTAPNLDKCQQRELKAAVERTESTITITTAPLMSGCGEYRFVIKADGSGGTTAHKVGDSEWALDRDRDRKMTIREP